MNYCVKTLVISPTGSQAFHCNGSGMAAGTKARATSEPQASSLPWLGAAPAAAGELVPAAEEEEEEEEIQ